MFTHISKTKLKPSATADGSELINKKGKEINLAFFISTKVFEQITEFLFAWLFFAKSARRSYL